MFNLFKDLAYELRRKNENFRKIAEEKLIEIFILIFNLVNAIIYHHLSVMKFFDTDDELVEYLTSLVAFSLNYSVKS